jgi:O-antigen/teichoic acid export membrane protein
MPPTAVADEITLEKQTHRQRALGLAIASSLLSKGGTILLILIALPMAYGALGKDRFGVFAALQSLMWLIGMADLGIGAGLARRLTLATSAGNREEQSRVMSTGFFMMTGVLLALAAVGALVLLLVPVELLYGQNFGPYAAELHMNLWLGGGIFLTLMILGILLKIREAYQEIHIFNMFGAVGNIISALLLYFGIAEVAAVWFILASIYGVQVVLWSINGTMALRQRPWLKPERKRFDAALARSLCAEGVGFFVLVGITPVFGREFIRWLLGHHFSPDVVGYFAILAQIGYIVFGVVFMLTYPLRPALVDASARGDFPWLEKTKVRLQKLWLVAALTVPAGLYFLGPWVVKVWFQKEIPLTPQEMGLYGCFLMLTIWTEIHCVLLSGLGKIRAAAIIAGLECAAVCLGAWIGVRTHGMSGALLGGACGILVTSFRLLPWLWNRSLREVKVTNNSTL